ncbi:NAD(P)H-dependent oxidoreductase subunit E [bacterium]|nr:NAD(P)H-dependent oxidoreductase subunit E [candidate division CSSED10-310 bacterium]
MADKRISEMRTRHEILTELSYPPGELDRGYANRTLHVDLDRKIIEIRPVSEQMKALWVGGKGFDLWLMFREINSGTRWDSPENPICFSSGPLGGTASFPGSGKTLVTSISPLTNSIMDSNVGGYFGPYLKFAGFDALCIVGKADSETILCIDAVRNRITLETAPLESIDSHLVAEEFTEMYAGSEDDKRNIAVVSAGRAADHIRIGVLNFSFYDWRRRVARLKQAGRGGIGRVFRDKKLKALVIRNRDYTPAWRIVKSKVSDIYVPNVASMPDIDRASVRTTISRWNDDPEYVIEMMQDIQDRDRHISKAAIDEINAMTGVPKAELYHIATFYKAFSLAPRGEVMIQVCVGTACHVKGSELILDAFERELGIRRGETTDDGRFSLEAVACLGCCSLAPVVKIDEEVFGNAQAKAVADIIERKRG